MRKTAASSSGGDDDDDALRLPLAAHADADDETVLSAARAAPRRPNKRGGCLRALPWALLAALALTMLLAMPGGLGVLLCACRARRGPAALGNATLAGHQGSEWPEPGNTLQALRVGARFAHFVHLDVALSRDGVAFVVAGHLEHTTNGSGTPCVRNAAYISALEVAPPTHDPQAERRDGKPCTNTSPRGGKARPCVYRVPTLDGVVADLPAHTRFMLQIDGCEASARPPECLPCVRLVEALTHVFKKHFIAQDRLYFVSRSAESTRQFMNAFADSTFLMLADHEYAHYSRSRFVQEVTEQKWDGVVMSTTLAGWRPDLGYDVAEARALRTSKKLERFAMPVRTDWDAKIALCAGVRNLVVAEPKRVAKLFGYKQKWRR